MTDPALTLEEAVAQLHRVRIEAAAWGGGIAVLRSQFEARISSDVQHAREAKDRMEAAEETVKSMAIAAYEASGKTNKHVSPGVEIKNFTVVDYNPEKALKWALDHRVCLSLDTKPFEKMAKDGMVDGFSGEIATVRDEPRAQIATDLEKVLTP